MASFTVTSEDSPASHALDYSGNGSPSSLSGSVNASNATGSASRFKVNAAPWRPSTNAPPPMYDLEQPQGGASNMTGKFNLCPQFMQHGYCGDASTCAYAHTFEELDPIARHHLQLMLSGSPSFSSSAAHNRSLQGSYQQVLAHQLMDADAPDAVPSSRRQLPPHARGMMPTHKSPATCSHNSSGASSGMCPPSPESHSSDISSVNSGSGAHPTAAAAQQDSQAPGAANNFGPNASPFIKSQMYYSQNANRATLPDRCRYPHSTAGSYYDYLNVKRCATKEEIIAKYQQWRDDGYRKASVIDVERADAMDRLIVDAKNILSSEKMRAEYDLLLPQVTAQVPFASVSSSNPPSSSQTTSPAPLIRPLPATGDSIW